MKKLPIEKLPKISQEFSYYIKNLKENKRSEVYETVLLMIFNKKLLKSIEALILDSTKSVKVSDKKFKFKIFSSNKEFSESLEEVCGSKYFKENFTAGEIERKKYIMSKIMLELSTYTIFKKYNIPNEFFIDKDGAMVAINSTELDHPLIDHSCVTNNGLKQFTLTFNEGATLNDITDYVKNTLKIGNRPLKKKLSLGKGYRLLLVEQNIKENIAKYSNEHYEYIEQLISREMLRIYNEKIGPDTIAKTIQRTKKIIEEINTKGDK